MYRPQLNPGEEVIKTSPDVIVKNVLFDAFLTNKRIIFVKKSEELYEKKELVFPINLVRNFDPKTDQAGTPTIEFLIQKPSGENGNLILKFAQSGDYRYFERDEWIEKLKIITTQAQNKNSYGAFSSGPDRTSQSAPVYNPPGPGTGGNIGYEREAPHLNPRQGFEPSGRPPVAPPPVPPYESRRNDSYGQPPKMPPVHEDNRQSPPRSPPAGYPNQYHNIQNRPPVPPHESHMPPVPPRGGMQTPPAGYDAGTVNKPSFCGYCGAKMPSGSVFCPSCGKKAESHSSKQQNAGGYGASPHTQNLNQRPPVPDRNAPDRYMRGGPDESFQRRAPPMPPVPPKNGGFSLADDPEFQNMRGNKRSLRNSKPQGNLSKAQEKAYKASEKQRLKEQKQYEKEQRKAVKSRGQRQRDPYGYKESRLPENLPMIIGGVVAVIVVIAVVMFALNSGMFSGENSPSPTNPGSSSSPAADYTPGSTSVSENFGTWHIQIIYSGQWSGSYSVNGVKTTITDDDGEPAIYGYKDIKLENPSGTITVTTVKDDGGSGVLMVDVINQKGQYAASGSSTASSDSVTVSATVS